jgi:hypothetical protein
MCNKSTEFAVHQLNICRVHCGGSVPNYLLVTIQLYHACSLKMLPALCRYALLTPTNSILFRSIHAAIAKFFRNYRLSSLIRISQTSRPHHHFFPFFPFPLSCWSMLLKISSNVVPLGSIPEVGVSPLRLETLLCPLG